MPRSCAVSRREAASLDLGRGIRLGRVAKEVDSMFKVKVYVTPKAGISDPQGASIERAVPSLGFDGVASIRVGRLITLEVDGADAAVVGKDVDAMCRQLLANPIIEDYRCLLYT